MKAKCRQCEFLNWDFITNDYESGPWFCGLHGRSRIDPDGDQPDLNHHGGCGFIKATAVRQYQLL